MTRDEGLDRGREFLKDTIRREVDFARTDQRRGLPPPPVSRPFPADGERLALPAPETLRTLATLPLGDAIANRRSRREYAATPLTVAELAFLLWATQGIRRAVNPATAFRTVPSAGCRHALETWLGIQRVEGVAPGLYRYLPVEHQLGLVARPAGLAGRLTAAALGQEFAGAAAVTFLWTAVPARMEWRYGAAAHKVIALDAGHVAQNLYLACEAIGCGTCAIAAYDQAAADALLGVDGTEEFVIYLAPVGKAR